MLLVTPNQGLAFPGLNFQLNFDSKHIIAHKNELQTILLLMERIQNTIIVSFILFLNGSCISIIWPICSNHHFNPFLSYRFPL